MSAPAVGNLGARAMSPSEWAVLVALSVLWGSSFLFNDVAVSEWPVMTVVAVRVIGAAAILMCVMRAAGERMPRNWPAWQALAGMALFNNILPFSLIVWGQQEVPVGVASILNASTPLFTLAFAHAMTHDEKLSAAKVLGMVCGFIGVAVMIGLDALDVDGVDVLAQVACLLGAMFYGLGSVWGRRFRRLGVTPLATATGQVMISSVLMTAMACVVDAPWTLPAPSPAVVGALFGVAALSTALAYVLYFRLLETVGATNLMLATFLIPVSAIFLGIAVKGEILAPRHLLGMALIGLGLAVIDGRLWRAIRRWRAGGA